MAQNSTSRRAEDARFREMETQIENQKGARSEKKRSLPASNELSLVVGVARGREDASGSGSASLAAAAPISLVVALLMATQCFGRPTLLSS